MNFTENDFTAMILHRMRQQELMAKAEHYRLSHPKDEENNRQERRSVREGEK